MDRRTVTTRVVFGLLALGFAACSFDLEGTRNLDTLLPLREDVPFVTPTSERVELVYEVPAQLAVNHGETCATGYQTLKVRQQLAMPREHDQGTVLLNGYFLRYRDSEQWVKGLGTGIGVIAVEGGFLTWQAAGEIADGSHNDYIEWCYTFTTITWSSSALAAVVDHADTMHIFQDRPWNAGTALRPIPGFLRNPAFVGSPQVAVLPRGFIGLWDGDSNQLLHVAYHQAAAEPFVEAEKIYGNGETPQPMPISSAAGDVVSWESMGFIKNDDLEWSQLSAELVTAFAGRDVGVINPPFNITPQEDGGSGCNMVGSPGIRSEERVVEGIPFESAIPVLSGWDLSYTCEDSNVRRIGAWIPNWSWSPGPTGGTLRYTVSTVLDSDDHWPFHSRTQIKILGFRRLIPKQ